MTEILEALKSIVEGLEIQTNSGQAKWLTGGQLAKIDKDNSFRKDEEKLDISLFYKMDSKTLIEYHCYIQHDHIVNSSWLSIENDGLQDGRISIAKNNLPELQGLEDTLYNMYILPMITSYEKSYQDDVYVLSKIVNKCGVQAARDYKLNTVLGEEKKGIFGKLFGK